MPNFHNVHSLVYFPLKNIVLEICSVYITVEVPLTLLHYGKFVD